jgi:DNA polymerase-3 subunit beta
MSSFECGPPLPHAPDDDATREWHAEAQCDAAELRTALTWVLRAVSRDATRPNLAVVMFDNDRLVATDGHRLHMARFRGAFLAPQAIESTAAGVLAATAATGDIALERSDTHLRFLGDHWQVITRIANSEFPPYRQVIPSRKAAACEVNLDGAVAVSALKMLPLLSGSRSQGIQIRLNGQLVLERHDDTTLVRRATVPLIRSTHRGDELVLGISARYLADALAEGGIQCLRFGGPLDPVVVEHDDGCIAVVMPMRL